MGMTSSRPQPPPPKKRRRKKKQARIYDYYLPHTRLQQSSGPMYHSIEVLASTGRAPHSARSARSYDEEYEDARSRVVKKDPIPKWRSKWEIDMRPDPVKEAEKLRTWLSMPLPELRNTSASVENITSKKRPKEKKRTARKNKRTVSPLSESEDKENEAFERKSVKSTKVDNFRMLYKTCDRSDNLLVQTARLWDLNTRRTSKFLSQDWNLKDVQMQETVPVIKQSKRVINVAPANNVD